jgi:hypothetical protein
VVIAAEWLTPNVSAVEMATPAP